MNVGEIFNRPFPIRPQPSLEWPLPDCYIGLEYEVENPSRADNPLTGAELVRMGQYFDVHEDGSLRDRGFEYVLRNPLYGDSLSDAIDLAAKAIEPFAKTYRTSLHVHVDARDMELSALQTMAYLYALTEKAFYLIAGPEREASNYCAPWSSSDEYLETASKLLFSLNHPLRMRDEAARVARYAGLNLAALHKYGSVEFRHAPVHWNAAKVKNWIKMAMLLKKAAMATPDLKVWQATGENKEYIYTHVFGPLYRTERFVIAPSDEDHEAGHLTATILASYMAAKQAAVVFGAAYKGPNRAYIIEETR